MLTETAETTTKATQPNEEIKETKSFDFELWVSLTTSIIAVALALSSILSNSVGDDLILGRTQANNAWGYFQAKSIKQGVMAANVEMLTLQTEDEAISPNYKEKINQKVETFKGQIARYEEEKMAIKKEAEGHEKVCLLADEKGNVLDLSEAIYQISLIMAAICLLAKSRILWFMSLSLGTIAMGISLYAYWFMP